MTSKEHNNSRRAFNPSASYSSLLPFAQLIRFSRPIGVVIINFPYLQGLCYAWNVTNGSAQDLMFYAVMLTFSTFWLRSWACAANDIADRKFDKMVARCRSRPMAREAISVKVACLFTAALTVIWFCVLRLFCPSAFIYGPPLFVLASVYPFTKRVTHYTPVFLGCTFAWGVLIGMSAAGIDPIDALMQHPTTTGSAMTILYLHNIVWTTIFETVYAFQDIEDDQKIGIGSMAVRYKPIIRKLLSWLAVLQVALLVELGRISSASFWYYAFAPLFNAFVLAWLVSTVDLTSPKDCGWWFGNGPLMVGTSICAGLLAL